MPDETVADETVTQETVTQETVAQETVAGEAPGRDPADGAVHQAGETLISSLAPAPEALMRRWLKAFGAFWWDFLVGDSPELLIGVLVAIGVVILLVRASGLNAAAVAAFPVLVAVLLGVSVYMARRAKR
ncbi:MAG: hypothetical protein ACRDZX_08455 [Acidimicrobiales bacterium]